MRSVLLQIQGSSVALQQGSPVRRNRCRGLVGCHAGLELQDLAMATERIQ